MDFNDVKIPNSSPLLKVLVEGAGLVCLYGVLALIASGGILGLEGYPYNQRGLDFFQQVEVFRLAIAAGDVLPHWNPFAQNGLGAAWPFQYPRVYGNAIALLANLIQSTYWAVKFSIPLGLMVGAIGLHKTAQTLGIKFSFCWCAATLLIFANYTYSTWLLRGELGEFWMAMLIPWLLYGCSQWFKYSTHTSIGLGLLLTILFWGNRVIFAYSLIPISLFLVTLRWRSRSQTQLFHCLVPGLSLVSLLLGGNWLTHHQVDTIVTLPLTTFDYNNFYRPPLSYLADTDFQWQIIWKSISVEIGRGVSISLLLALVLTGLQLNPKFSPPVHLLKSTNIRFLCLCVILTLVYIQYDWFRPLYPEHPELLPLYFACTIFLLLALFLNRDHSPHPLTAREQTVLALNWICIIFIYLQLPISIWFYAWIPGANHLQFPWQLLSFMTPLVSLLCCERLDALSNLEAKIVLANVYRAVAIAIVAVQITFGIRVQAIQYPNYSMLNIQQALQPQQLAASSQFVFTKSESRIKRF